MAQAATDRLDLPLPRRKGLELLAGALGYAAIAALAWHTLERDRFLEGLDRLRPWHLIIILGVALAHVAGRALRYHALVLRAGPRDYRLADGIRIFLAGLCLSAVTPARAGDLVKARLVRRHGIPASAGLGLVMVERALDLLVVAAAIALFGALLSGRAAADAWRGAGLLLLASLVAGVGFLTWRRARALLAAAASRLAARLVKPPGAERVRELLAGLFGTWDQVFASPARFAAFALVSAGIWAVEFGKLYLVLRLLGLEVAPAVVFFVYPLSIVAGILTILPFSEGVVGVTGVALLASLTAIDPASAAVAVVVDRAASVLPPLCLWGAWSTLPGGALPPDRRPALR